MNMTTEALKLAAEYGFRIFPVRHPRDGGDSPGKLPLIKGWPAAATNHSAIIDQWWAQWPDANIGIATGEKSGVYVLDVDIGTGGMASLERLKETIDDWPDTLTARTGSGGLHFYFRYRPGDNIRNSTSAIGPGLDIRGEGGFVVAPPSLHASGNRYEWI